METKSESNGRELCGYKGEVEKCLKILYALQPPITLLNGPPGVGKQTFCARLKANGFNIYTLEWNSASKMQQLERIQAFLRRPHNGPVIISTFIETVEDIKSLFTLEEESLSFSYVFLYPNERNQYRLRLWAKVLQGAESVRKAILGSSFDDPALAVPRIKETLSYEELEKKWKEMPAKFRERFTKLVLDYAERAKKTYQQHTEYYKQKILTALI